MLFWFSVGLFFLWALSVVGCSPLSRMDPAQLGSLSDAQIERLDKAGQAVVGCLVVGGPPPVGGGTLVLVPKSAKGSVKFGVDCHPSGEITLSGGVATP